MNTNQSEKKCQVCGALTVNPDYGDGPICDKCAAGGWTANPSEIIDEINKDPKLKAMYPSPFGNI